MAAANARLGRLDEAHRALAEANQEWPYDTVRMHYPDNPFSSVSAAQIDDYQAALRLAGHRDHADEAADFGAASDNVLHADFAGPTPTTAPGAVTIRTAELARLLAEQKPIVIDPMMYWWGRSIPGAIGLKLAGWGGSYTDVTQERLRRKMQVLTNRDLSAPIVALGFNSERFDGRNLALRWRPLATPRSTGIAEAARLGKWRGYRRLRSRRRSTKQAHCLTIPQLSLFGFRPPVQAPRL